MRGRDAGDVMQGRDAGTRCGQVPGDVRRRVRGYLEHCWGRSGEPYDEVALLGELSGTLRSQVARRRRSMAKGAEGAGGREGTGAWAGGGGGGGLLCQGRLSNVPAGRQGTSLLTQSRPCLGSGTSKTCFSRPRPERETGAGLGYFTRPWRESRPSRELRPSRESRPSSESTSVKRVTSLKGITSLKRSCPEPA